MDVQKLNCHSLKSELFYMHTTVQFTVQMAKKCKQTCMNVTESGADRTTSAPKSVLRLFGG